MTIHTEVPPNARLPLWGFSYQWPTVIWKSSTENFRNKHLVVLSGPLFWAVWWNLRLLLLFARGVTHSFINTFMCARCPPDGQSPNNHLCHQMGRGSLIVCVLNGPRVQEQRRHGFKYAPEKRLGPVPGAEPPFTTRRAWTCNEIFWDDVWWLFVLMFLFCRELMLIISYCA